MKKFILLFFLVAFFCSCNNKSPIKTEPKKSKSEIDYELADMFLEYDAEKIGLLSIIKNIPCEQTKSVLRDYLAKTYGSTLSTMENPEYLVKVVDTIAQKNNLSKKITASIIFSYQYEMITRDEIIENYQDEKMDYLNEMDQY